MRKKSSSEQSAETLGFGKHKGSSVRSVDDSYLVWCVENVPYCPAIISDELVRRSAFNEDLVPYAMAFAYEDRLDKEYRDIVKSF